MKHPNSIGLVLAVALTGCSSLPFATPTPTYTSTSSKVKVMTSTFSLSQNAGLNQAVQSLNKFLSSVQGAFNGAPPRAFTTDELVRSLRVAGMGETYRLAGVQAQGNATFVYDDASKELTGIKGTNIDVKFDFKASGDAHTWQATIVQSPDGTTGSFSITMKGAWKDAPAASSMQFKVFNNQVPERIDSVDFHFQAKPQGNDKLAMDLAGKLDQPRTMPGALLAVPTHWTAKATVPGISLDWTSSFDPSQDHVKATVQSNLSVDVDHGAKERFQLVGRADQDLGKLSVSLTNLGAKMKVAIEGTQANRTSQMAFDSSLIGTDNNQKVGTVTMTRPGHVTITLNDGTTQDWELFAPGQTPGVPGLSLPGSLLNAPAVVPPGQYPGLSHPGLPPSATQPQPGPSETPDQPAPAGPQSRFLDFF